MRHLRVMKSGEDSNESSNPPLSNEVFQRVDPKTNLVSPCLLLTMQIRENGRASAFPKAVSRSAPATRRPRTPKGPLGSSPQKNDLHGNAQPPSVTAFTTHAPVLDTRDTRRNMLSHELTESLRRHILWERQEKGLTINAHTHHRVIQPTLASTNGNSCSNYSTT